MPIETISFKGLVYPAFQAEGNAAFFCRPFAEKICKGVGFDIGYCKEEWLFPGSIGIEPTILAEFHAMNLPPMQVDYIHSSHMLEHYDGSWVKVLDYWTTKIKQGGILFLYLPDFSQHYWRSWNNRKHVHNFTPDVIREYLIDSEKYTKIFVSGVDAYNSFLSFAQKI